MSTTARFYITGGTSSYVGKAYVALDLEADTVIYQRYDGQTPEATTANISYTKSTGLWHEGPGSATPGFLNSVNSSVGASASVLDANTIYGFNDQYAYRFSFESPWFDGYAKSIEFDTVTNSIKYVVGPDWAGVFVQQQSSSNHMYYHNYDVPVLQPGDSPYTGYITFDPDVFDSFDGIWSLRSYSQTIASVVVANDPPENDPPPSPVFVPRSARRGNLNFW